MDQNFVQDDIAIAATAGWMSVEELAEERWVTLADAGGHSVRVELSEEELPF